MKKMTSFIKKLWNDESGQGSTEYILLLMVIVALALLFRNKIYEAIGSKLEQLGQGIGAFTGDPNGG